MTELDRWQRRLAEELDDDGVRLPDHPVVRRLVVEELDHCRRAPMFEGRQPTYGSLILAADDDEARRRALHEHTPFDVVPLAGDGLHARVYADGRSSYLVRAVDGSAALACFERSMLFEADLVELQRLTGAIVVQRTPVLDVVRIVADGSVISWDGSHWRSRPTAASLRDDLVAADPDGGERLVAIAELAIHWLAPSRVGATIVVGLGPGGRDSLDLATAVATPPLSVVNRRHSSALTAVLRQHDLAVLVDRDGVIRKMAVGLRWSDEAEAAVDDGRGMRHRSAQRFSHDHPKATIVVVSEDGPVTVFRNGRVVATTGPSDAGDVPSLRTPFRPVASPVPGPGPVDATSEGPEPGGAAGDGAR